MTGRIATMSMDGTRISKADIERIETEEHRQRDRQRRAACVIASSAHDAGDCRLLLDILGLDRDVIAAARKEAALRVGAPGGTRAA